MRIRDTIGFIRKAKIVHSDKYIYTKSEYKNTKTKICIICPKHGEFWQKPSGHLNGKGCKKCYDERRGDAQRLSKDEFIDRANKIHNGKYDYSKVIYKNSHNRVCIICPKHGEFQETPNNHLNGHGCSKCGIEETHKLSRSNKNDFIEKATLIHGNKYDYSKVEYVNNKTKVCIICPNHGEFWQKPNDHLTGYGCKKCSLYSSKAESEICSILSKIGCEQHNRTILGGKEIDIYVPSIKLGIEYDGCLWHTEENGKDSTYHFNKTKECNEHGIELIHIFEDEWVYKRDICEYMIKDKCNLNTYANVNIDGCEIVEISDNNKVKDFLNVNCLFNDIDFSKCIGAYKDDDLIGLITLKTIEKEKWLITTFSNNIKFKCNGVESELIKYFIKHYDFKELYFEADRRWWTKKDETILMNIGFNVDRHLQPKFFYYNNKFNKLNRYKNIPIREETYKMVCSNSRDDEVRTLDFTKIWDCGYIIYKYIKNE